MNQLELSPFKGFICNYNTLIIDVSGSLSVMKNLAESDPVLKVFYFDLLMYYSLIHSSIHSSQLHNKY